MRNVVKPFYAVGFLLLLPLLAHAQAKPSRIADSTKKESTLGAITGAFFSRDMWWFWLGIIVILGLLGLLFYMKRNNNDD